jgi:PAS domain S-box-containing protein
MKKIINKLSVRGKIFLIIGINLFFLLVVGVVSYLGLTKLNDIKEEITTNSLALQSQQAADMMHDALRGDCYNAMLTEKTDYKGKSAVKADINDHSEEFLAQVKFLNSIDLPTNVAKSVKAVQKPLMNYIDMANRMVDATIAKDYSRYSPSFMKLNGEFSDAFGTLEDKMGALSELIAKVSEVKMKEGNEYAKQIKLLIIILIASIILIAIIISVYISNKITTPINETKLVLDKLSVGEDVDTIEVESKDEIGSMVDSINSVVTNMNAVKEYVSEVGTGNFETDIEIFNNQGAIYSSLNAMRESLKQTTEDEKKRNWATEGLAKFGDILRGNNDGLEVLADNIISGLIKYLGANQGGLFVVNDNNHNDVYLELIACYAWNKKKYINMRVDEGEGLVGQAWQEADTLYITDVPQDFVKITSGLGDANPKSFLIVPLTVNDVTFGVIEIASFHLFEQYQIDFVNKLAESIASTLSTAKTNERTKILLEQSQQQTEEMRAQEEEMRQNMEEMQATQEEMERKEGEMTRMVEQMQQQEEEMRQNMEEMVATQEEMDKQNAVIIEKTAEMQGTIDGINATMATIEFTPDGHVITANDNFLHTMKCDLSDIYGKHHRTFVTETMKNSNEYKTFWSDLAAGKPNKGEFERVNLAGETVWLNAIYNPIRNSKGEIIKVIKFATDITELKLK